MHKHVFSLLAVSLAIPAAAFADFQYQEKTQITGGSLVSMMKFAGAFSRQARQATDPVVSSVYLKGNRMARVSANNTEIIDLDKETLTMIDHAKKQYTVVTFEQLKQQMERAAAKMEQEQKKQKAQQPSSAPDDTRMSFDVKVRDTGATKDISGMAAKEAILSMSLTGTDTKTNESGSLAIANDMWMVPGVPGYSELRDFQIAYAAKMGTMLNDSAIRSLAAMQPGMTKGTAEMVKEMSKLTGVPVLQVMRVGMSKDGKLPAASEAPLPPSAEMPSGNDIAKAAGTATAASVIESRVKGLGGLAGGLSGLGGLGRNKKKAEAPAEPTAASPAYAVLMETNSEMSGFSTDSVDPVRLNVPAGYQQMPWQEKQ